MPWSVQGKYAEVAASNHEHDATPRQATLRCLVDRRKDVGLITLSNEFRVPKS